MSYFKPVIIVVDLQKGIETVWNEWDIKVKNVLFWMEVPTNTNI